MVKIISFLCIFYSYTHAQDVFERNCIPCHQTLPSSLQEMFKHYLLVYSGENNVKAGIKHYLRYPSTHISVMSKLFISNYGIKSKTLLNPEELTQAVDSYWERYKVIGKLK